MTIVLRAYYRWSMRNETQNHCSRCHQLTGQVKTMEQWDVIGTPPLHPGCACALDFDRAEAIPMPDSPGLATPRVSNPAGIDGQHPAMAPRPEDHTPTYPPQTPPSAQPETAKKSGDIHKSETAKKTGTITKTITSKPGGKRTDWI